MATGSLGGLVVSLTAETSQFTAAMDKAAYTTEQAQKKMARDADLMGQAFGAGAAVAVAAMAAMTVRAINAADHLRDLSQSSAINLETLNGLGFAAGQAGGDLDSMAAAAGKLSKSIAEAAGGDKAKGEAFKALGINLQDATGKLKTADVVLAELADKFASYADGPEKIALALELMGKSGAAQIPLLNEGGQAMRENIEYARTYSGMTTELADQSDVFNDSMGKLNLQQTRFGNLLATAVLPVLQAVADEILKAAENSDLMTTAAAGARNVLQTLVVNGSEVAFTFRGVGEAIGLFMAMNAAMIKGDFAGARTMGAIAKDDWAAARVEHDKFIASVMKPLPAAASFGAIRAGAMDSWDEKKAAPRLTSGGTPKSAAKGKDPDADFNTYLTNLDRQIEKIEKLTTVEILLAEIQSGRLTVSANQQAQLTALAAQIDGEKEAVITLKMRRQTAIDAGDAVLKANEEYQRLLKSLTDTTPSSVLQKQRTDMEFLTQALQDGIINEQLYLEAVTERLDLVAAKTEKSKSAAEELGLTFSSAFEDAIVSGKSFSDVIQGLGADILKLVVRLTVTEPLAKTFTSMFSGAGTAGSSAGGAGFWGSAIGWLGGLMGFASGTDYVPRDMVAKIHQGEKIIPAGANRSSGISITSNPVINIDARSDQAQVRQLVAREVRAGNAKLIDDLQIAGAL